MVLGGHPVNRESVVSDACIHKPAPAQDIGREAGNSAMEAREQGAPPRHSGRCCVRGGLPRDVGGRERRGREGGIPGLNQKGEEVALY